MIRLGRREIGLRMALGAQTRTVVGAIVGRGVLLTIAGLEFGGARTVIAGRAMQGLLFGVGSRDPAAFGVSAVAFTAVAFLAAAVPALRAARVDPMLALREG